MYNFIVKSDFFIQIIHTFFCCESSHTLKYDHITPNQNPTWTRPTLFDRTADPTDGPTAVDKPKHHLRSDNKLLLYDPGYKMAYYWKRTFSYDAPYIKNDMPESMHIIESKALTLPLQIVPPHNKWQLPNLLLGENSFFYSWKSPPPPNSFVGKCKLPKLIWKKIVIPSPIMPIQEDLLEFITPPNNVLN